MKRPILTLLTASLLVGAMAWQPTGAGAGPLDPNPWLARRVLNIAHQGGENEAPSNTMYAFKTAMQKGADVLELDVHATSDGRLVVLHDATVDRTTNGSGRVDQMTLAQIQALDAANWFVPMKGTTHSAQPSEYTLRGIATGAVAPPEGFTAEDFRIPSLEEVFDAFPGVFINIEIKNTLPDTTPYEHILASQILQNNRSDEVIVVSFLDHALEMFKLWAPNVPTATATVETAAFYATAVDALPGAPNPRYVALQVPIVFQGIRVITKDFIDNAHANGLAVHAWTINTRAEMEMLIDLGIDGLMTDNPTLLQTVLVERGLA